MNFYKIHTQPTQLYGYDKMQDAYEVEKTKISQELEKLGFDDVDEEMAKIMEYADAFGDAFASGGGDMGEYYDIMEELNNVVEAHFPIDWDERKDAEEVSSTIVKNFEKLFSFWYDL